MGALGEGVTGTGIIEVGYGCGVGVVVIIEVLREKEEEVDIGLVDVVLTVVRVLKDDVEDGVEVVEISA